MTKPFERTIELARPPAVTIEAPCAALTVRAVGELASANLRRVISRLAGAA